MSWEARPPGTETWLVSSRLGRRMFVQHVNILVLANVTLHQPCRKSDPLNFRSYFLNI